MIRGQIGDNHNNLDYKSKIVKITIREWDMCFCPRTMDALYLILISSFEFFTVCLKQYMQFCPTSLRTLFHTLSTNRGHPSITPLSTIIERKPPLRTGR